MREREATEKWTLCSDWAGNQPNMWNEVKRSLGFEMPAHIRSYRGPSNKVNDLSNRLQHVLLCPPANVDAFSKLKVTLCRIRIHFTETQYIYLCINTLLVSCVFVYLEWNFYRGHNVSIAEYTNVCLTTLLLSFWKDRLFCFSNILKNFQCKSRCSRTLSIGQMPKCHLICSLNVADWLGKEGEGGGEEEDKTRALCDPDSLNRDFSL